MSKVEIDGREYEITHQMEMDLYPNLQKYIRFQWVIKGKRGAQYSLAQRIDGSYYVQNLSGSGKCSEAYEVTFHLNGQARACRYAIKCHECKTEVGRTNIMRESVAGRICSTCRDEITRKANQEVK